MICDVIYFFFDQNVFRDPTNKLFANVPNWWLNQSRIEYLVMWPAHILCRWSWKDVEKPWIRSFSSFHCYVRNANLLLRLSNASLSQLYSQNYSSLVVMRRLELIVFIKIMGSNDKTSKLNSTTPILFSRLKYFKFWVLPQRWSLKCPVVYCA